MVVAFTGLKKERQNLLKVVIYRDIIVMKEIKDKALFFYDK